MTELIKNKLTFFSSVVTITGGTTFPTNYRTGKIFYSGYEVKQVETNDIANTFGSSFHALGLQKNPVYTESSVTGEDILVFDSVGQVNSGVSVEIISQPSKVEWGYDVVGEKALHNGGPTRTTHFELHSSEETNLVMKILELGGVIIEDPNVVQYANQEQIQTIQQEKQ